MEIGMEEYFSSTVNKLKTNNYSNLTIVLGNESCDLDSAVSSIVYALFLHWQHYKIKCKVCTASKRGEQKDDIFVSVLDVRREDFPLKTEVVFCLAQHGITEKDLVFSDDIDFKNLVAEGNTKIVLVDHHILAKKYEGLAPYVTEIIDHRPLDKSCWTFNDDVRCTIEAVGSCCTLLAQRARDLSALTATVEDFFLDHPACADLLRSEYCGEHVRSTVEAVGSCCTLLAQRARDLSALTATDQDFFLDHPACADLLRSEYCGEHVRSTVEAVGSCCTLLAQRARDLSALTATDQDFFLDHPACADLLRSVILLDTLNFSKELNKATKHDEEIVLFLERLLKLDQGEQERKLRVDSLLAARSDVSRLTAAQLLRKDLKAFGCILVPSFPVLVKEFLQKPNALEAVSEALSSRRCSLALLLGMDLKEGLRRDAAVISSDDELAEKLSKFLREWSSPTLQLVPEPGVHRFYYKQMNLTATRKQYVPALNEYSSTCN